MCTSVVIIWDLISENMWTESVNQHLGLWSFKQTEPPFSQQTQTHQRSWLSEIKPLSVDPRTSSYRLNLTVALICVGCNPKLLQKETSLSGAVRIKKHTIQSHIQSPSVCVLCWTCHLHPLLQLNSCFWQCVSWYFDTDKCINLNCPSQWKPTYINSITLLSSPH